MKRLAAVTALVALTSCAHVPPAQGATHYTVRPVTGYVTLNDDMGATCTVPVPIPAMVADSVWVRCEWWQSAVMLRADSLRTPRAAYLTFQPPPELPNATRVTSTVYLRDVGGTSCSATYNQTPVATLVKPAAFSGLTLVP